MDRLGKEGLTRHDAVHAIGSVVAEHLFDILKTDQNDDAADFAGALLRGGGAIDRSELAQR